MAGDKSPDVIRAAGGVVWRSADRNGDLEVCVIHRPRYDDWSIPKGKLGPGESEVEGAIREVFEETGLRVHVGRPLGEARYTKVVNGVARPKVVRYWAMEADGGDFLPTREVDDLRWLSLADAQQLVTHEHDKELLERFARGPALLGLVLLVRHASAGDRAAWEGDDRLRPLDSKGWEQAEQLVRLLSRFDVHKIVSADYERCIQTVRPFAEAVGLQIDLDPVFSEDAHPRGRGRAIERLRELAATRETTVVCSQGNVIPDLVTDLAAADDADLPTAPTKKGSVWALSFDGDKLFAGEYFAPPSID